MKVLVVEDDLNMSEFLRAHLPARGFVVDVVMTGQEAISASRVNEYDLIILDLHLPDIPGDIVLETLRGTIHLPPILMLTVVSDAASKVRILNAGADD
jgi:DNA-binding response OmpR family regulator